MNILGGNKFSQIPEWVIDADISDGAFRLYAVLLRYAKNETGEAYPALDTLATRLRKNEKSVRRYAKELSDNGLVHIQNRGKKSNLYTIMKQKPSAVNRTQVSSKEPLTGHSCPSYPDNSVPVNRTQMSNELYPQNYTHLTKSDPADAGTHTDPEKDHTVQGELLPSNDPQPPAKKKTPEQSATEVAYEQTGKAFNFIAVRQILKWAIHERGLTEQQASQSVVALYQAGKPILKQTLGQFIDGHMPISRQNSSDSWADLGGQLQNYAEQKGWPA